MSAEIAEGKQPKFERLEDGSIIRWSKGQPVKLAQYDEEEGVLTYENEEARVKFAAKVVNLVEFTDEGKTATGDPIKRMTVKGRAEDKISPKEPPCPKPTKMLGDKSKPVVEWWFRWRPQEAYVRYGVQLDEGGEPIRVHGKRRNMIQRENPVTGLREYTEQIYEKEDGFLALRGTHLTFTKEEVVGYADGSDTTNEYAPETQDE